VSDPARQPGQPIADRSRWRILYDEMRTLREDEVLTYEEMGKLLGLNFRAPKDRQIINVSARKAADELQRLDRRIVQIVRGIGYQPAQPQQVLVLARRHQARAVVEVEAGRAKIESVDLSTVDATTARLIEATAMGFTRQAMMMRQLDVRQERLESTMAAVSATAHTAITRVDATESTVEDLQRRVHELEANLRHDSRHTHSPPTASRS
jgi:hypothetical protein